MPTTESTTTPGDDNQQQHPIPPTTTPAGWPRWAVTALAWLRTCTTTVQRFVLTDPGGAARLLGTAIGTLITGILLIGALDKTLVWVSDGHPARDLAATVPAVRIVTDPIGHWLAVHTAGLPLPVPAAAWLWGGLGLVLFYCAVYQHRAARLLWLGYGAATAAMVWSGTDTAAHRPVSVGLAAVAWSALALLALRGRPHAVRPGTSDQD